MSDTRRQAAEEWANRIRGNAFDRDHNTPSLEWREVRDAHEVGQVEGEARGERRAVEGIVRWLRSGGSASDLQRADAIERGEWKETPLAGRAIAAVHTWTVCVLTGCALCVRGMEQNP